MRGDLCGERLEGFAAGADEDVCEGGLLDRGERDEDDFCSLKLEFNASVRAQLLSFAFKLGSCTHLGPPHKLVRKGLGALLQGVENEGERVGRVLGDW